MAERAHPILYVIATLLVVNVALTGALVFRQPAAVSLPASDARPLPSVVTDEARDQLFSRVQQKFNERDVHGLFTLFDEYAREQMSEETFEKQMSPLVDLFGTIESGTYSHYVFAGAQGERGFYTLFFNTRHSGTQFPNGQATLTLTSDGSSFGLVGFHLATQAK